METDKQRIHSFYDNYLEKHGMSAGWTSMDYALKLYGLSSKSIYQNWASIDSVLDVGSGEGHLLNFLRQHRQFVGQYTGIELLPQFHQQAIQNNGNDSKAHFVQEEFLAYDFGDTTFDWTFSLGSLSVLQPNQAAHDMAFCQKMGALARQGMTIYLNDAAMTKHVDLQTIDGLATHHIDNFIQMLGQLFSPISVEVSRLLPLAPQGVILQVRFN
jgi:SAM-dependent methyltransferase